MHKRGKKAVVKNRRKRKMLLERLKKENVNLVKTSYRIGDSIEIYYPKPVKGELLYSDPQESDITIYNTKNIPRNTFEGYCDEETGISIITFSIGRKLYLRPDFERLFPIFSGISKNLVKMGLKPGKMNTPFSNGGIPVDKEWNSRYRFLKAQAEEFSKSFEEEMFGFDSYEIKEDEE